MFIAFGESFYRIIVAKPEKDIKDEVVLVSFNEYINIINLQCLYIKSELNIGYRNWSWNWSRISFTICCSRFDSSLCGY